MFKTLIKGITEMFDKRVTISGISNSKVTINGQTFDGADQQIIMKEGKTFVNGKEIVSTQPIYITITGDVESIDAANCSTITVNGRVGTVSNSNGIVKVEGSVTGSVETSNGQITVGGDILCDASTSNANITAGSIHGKATTSNGNVTTTGRTR